MSRNLTSERADPGGADSAIAEDEPEWAKTLLAPVVAASYWFDPGDQGKPYTARIRFTGHRRGVKGRPERGDRFEEVEVVEGVVPGSGPVSVTTRAQTVKAGDWFVTAEQLSRHSDHRSGLTSHPRTLVDRSVLRDPGLFASILHWGTPMMTASLPGQVSSQPGPFARVPGSVVGSWPVLVGLGAVVGLAVQAELIQRAKLDAFVVLGIALVAALAGLVGAKLWFLGQARRGSVAILSEGLCIQGFIVGASVVLIGGLLVFRLPIGTVIDASTPGLFIGMAIGRPGCFLTGCCAGRPTASRWGIWASDRRVGARRIPVQLWEALLALAIGLTALALVVQNQAPIPGAIAIAGLATYTLGRQFLFRFRLQPRRSSLGRPLVAVLAGAIVAADALYWLAVGL